MALFRPLELEMHNANETTFGVSVAGSFSTLPVLCLNRPTLDLKRTIHHPPVNSSFVSGVPVTPDVEPIHGLKNMSKLTYEEALRSIGTANAAGDGTDAPATTTSSILHGFRSAFGFSVVGTGTTVNDASASAQSFDVTDASGLNYGMAIAIEINGSLEVGIIMGISTNTITMFNSFSAAPADEAEVYAAVQFYPYFSAQTRQFRATDDLGQEFRLLGCRGVPSIKGLSPGEFPTVSWEWMVTDWSRTTGETIARTDYSAVTSPVPGYQSTVQINDTGTYTRNVVDVASIELDLGIEMKAQPSVSGVQGVATINQTMVAPKMTITIPQDATWHRELDPNTEKNIILTYGSVAGEMVTIMMPNATLDETPSDEDIEGVFGAKVTFRGRYHTAGASPATDAPISICFL